MADTDEAVWSGAEAERGAAGGVREGSGEARHTRSFLPVLADCLLHAGRSVNSGAVGAKPRQGPCPHGACGLAGWQTPIKQLRTQMSNAMVQGVMVSVRGL